MAYLIQEKDLSPELRQKLIFSGTNAEVLEEVKKISSNHQLTEDSEVLKNFFAKQKISVANLDAELEKFISDTKTIQEKFAQGFTTENFGGQFKSDFKNLQDGISALIEQTENFQDKLNQLQIFFDEVDGKNNSIQTSVQEKISESENKIENIANDLKNLEVVFTKKIR